ncbi:MAG: hypothetical protein APR63_08685 [Desulfuromonas sp. SDB]|nr:MAG: hypothetical protein APR63_08685 [Desulfuromonas sp. SDB]
MKIAVNFAYYGEKSGGLGEYIYNLCKNLYFLDKKNKYIFYISLDQEEYWKTKLPFIKNYKIIPFKIHERTKRSLFQNSYWKKEEYLEKFDVFHSPFFHLPHCIKCKKIITFHDLRLKNFPETYKFRRRVFLEYAIRKSLNIVDKIITVSEFTKDELIKFYNISENKIIPIHEGIDYQRFNIDNITQDYENKLLNKFNLNKKNYILTVGHLEPRKNLLRLIIAFKKLRKVCDKIDYLVIVGKKNFKYKKILNEINKNKDSIIHLDFVHNNDLNILYKNAKVFVFPSIYEGFGFPPLEAAIFGIPSAVSKTSSMPEICEDAVLYFNPFNTEDIKSKILMLLNNNSLYNELKIKAQNNLKRFSWEKNVIKTIDVYNETYQ